MNILKKISTLFILISLFSCEPPVTFSEPQPTDTDNMSEFPKRLQGHYLNVEDNSILTIGDKLMLRTYNYDVKIHLNQLDSTTQLSGDTLFDSVTNEKTIIKRDGDSITNYVHYIDTLFKMDNDNVVRKFKGYYFLNTCHNKASWEVKKVQLAKGLLFISSITSKQDIENLKKITESTADTIAPYNITITKKQFKEFVKNDGFSNTETFVRLSEDSF